MGYAEHDIQLRERVVSCKSSILEMCFVQWRIVKQSVGMFLSGLSQANDVSCGDADFEVEQLTDLEVKRWWAQAFQSHDFRVWEGECTLHILTQSLCQNT